MRSRTIAALVLLALGLYRALQDALTVLSAPALANGLALSALLLASAALVRLTGVTLAVRRPHA